MPFGINNLGQVVGWFGNNNGDDHGFLRNPDGTISTFDALGSSVLYTRLFGINDSGVMVGEYREAQEFGLMISAQGSLRGKPARFRFDERPRYQLIRRYRRHIPDR